MPKIIVREKDSIEEILRNFKREVSKSGNLAAARRKEFYIKPSTDRKNRRNKNLSR